MKKISQLIKELEFIKKEYGDDFLENLEMMKKAQNQISNNNPLSWVLSSCKISNNNLIKTRELFYLYKEENKDTNISYINFRKELIKDKNIKIIRKRTNNGQLRFFNLEFKIPKKIKETDETKETKSTQPNKYEGLSFLERRELAKKEREDNNN